MNPKPTNIHLSVRRWRDKINGNSYFSARVYADGVLIRVIPFQYGYGQHPMAVALDAYMGEDAEGVHLGAFCRINGIRYTEDDAWALKRECVAYGKGD